MKNIQTCVSRMLTYSIRIILSNVVEFSAAYLKTSLVHASIRIESSPTVALAHGIPAQGAAV